MDTNTIAYRNAKRQVERTMGFYSHLAIYLLVNTGLILVNLSREGHPLWSFAPLFGWGIGLLFHGLSVFLHAPRANWKHRMIENEIAKQEKSPTA